MSSQALEALGVVARCLRGDLHEVDGEIAGEKRRVLADASTGGGA